MAHSPDEPGRIAALRSYEVLDTPADPRIDVFVRVAAQFYDVPFSMVSLVDAERVWFKASIGVDVPEIPRDSAFCSHVVADPRRVMVVEDARDDDRFATTDFVAGQDGFRFYAGAPIITADGYALGTLCILDRKARTLDEPGRQRLADLATGVGAVLDLHRHAIHLRRAATHDPLTGLPNRALFNPALAKAAQGATDATPVALVCFDLDGFKAVNDRFGHSGGDTLLRVVADRLRNSIRPTDLPARLGGDEFALLLHSPLDPDTPRLVADRILAALAEPVRIGGHSVPIRASAGFAAAPADAGDGPSLMRAADAALYAAKSSGRRVPAGAAPGRADAGTDLVDDLRTAVAGGTLDIAWQPYFDLATRQLGGYEALLRWTRPGFGPVPPETFLPIAEADGLARNLDSWVLDTVCHEAARPGRMPEASVNVTQDSFHAPGFVARVAAALARSGLPGQQLVLEVDQETACLDAAATTAVVQDLGALGVTVALHNFGIGASALACLREVPFGRIKLARAFVGQAGQERRMDALIRSLVQMGMALGSTVCAEGIETPGQLAFMRDAGCQFGQGFLLGVPAPYRSHPGQA